MLCAKSNLVRRAPGLLGVLVVLGACTAGPPERARADTRRQLVVGEHSIGPGLVAAAAAAAGVGRAQAAERLVRDARLAQWLTREWPDRAQQVRRLALARATLEALLAESRARPIDEEEFQELAEEQWWLWDRPRLVRTAHAVVLSTPPNEAALQVAKSLRARLGAAAGALQLLEACRAEARSSKNVRCEELLPVAADGRAVDPEQLPPRGPSPQRYAPEFAVAAVRLLPGAGVSPVTPTPFGYHVIAATAVYPARRLGPQAASLREAVAERRARRALKSLLRRRSAGVSRSARALGLTAGLLR